MLIEVNRFCESGVYRDVRYQPANTVVDDALNGPATGLARNVAACRAVSLQLSNFFVSGVQTLIGEDDAPFVHPIRPRTRIMCGRCGHQFDPRLFVSQLQLVRCTECSRCFCAECYDVVVKNIQKKLGTWPITHEILARNPRILRCRPCGGK
jgi:hypothetical protein